LEENLELTLCNLGVPPQHSFLHIEPFDQDEVTVQPLSIYIQPTSSTEISLLGALPELKTSTSGERKRINDDDENMEHHRKSRRVERSDSPNEHEDDDLDIVIVTQ
jgi:hypothetical protein